VAALQRAGGSGQEAGYVQLIDRDDVNPPVNEHRNGQDGPVSKCIPSNRSPAAARRADFRWAYCPPLTRTNINPQIPHGSAFSVNTNEVIDAESRHYALKTMTQQKVDTQKLKRFQNEIRFCQQTTHRNIAQILAIERGGAGRGAGTWPV
jgi:hypothetical protein